MRLRIKIDEFFFHFATKDGPTKQIYKNLSIAGYTFLSIHSSIHVVLQKYVTRYAVCEKQNKLRKNKIKLNLSTQKTCE